MTPFDILQAARVAGIAIGLDNDDLVVEAACEPDPALLAALSRCKQEIVSLLRAEQEWIPAAAEEAFNPSALAGARKAPPAPPIPRGSDNAADTRSFAPLRCSDGRLLWRFPAGPPSDVNPLPLMLRARNRGVELVRDGDSLIVAAREALHPEVLLALQRHCRAVLDRLSREAAERIARFERGEKGLVTEVLIFDPKQGGSE